MTLSKEIYKEFEDVLGAEYICDDPAIMSAYHKTKHAAVVLPENTGQVQAIVKLCVKYKLKFRPICTGWTGVFAEGLILLDLRRMNRILEINEKNMYAVVEPYVIGAQLQAELFKRGLVCNVKGSGSNCSAMLRGHGHLDQSTGGDDRNHLAIEWVTPEGNIVRSGSLGSTDEWFCGDGPGPSMRAILTSAVPPGTTPGVFTKACIKLYHWAGPVKWPTVGQSPVYPLSELPANMAARYYSFPSVEKLWNAEIALGENEITFELMGFNTNMLAGNLTTSNEEEDVVFERLNKEVQGPGFFVIVAGNNQYDFAFKMKALEKIISDNDGKVLESVLDSKTEGLLLSQNTRISCSIRETMRNGGAFKSIPIMGQRDLTIKWAIGAGIAKLPLIEKGYIADDAGGFFGWGVEQGHLGKTEIFCKFSPSNEEAFKHVMEWQDKESARAIDDFYFANTIATEAEVNNKIGPALDNYHLRWRKIRAAVDPNDISPEGCSLV